MKYILAKILKYEKILTIFFISLLFFLIQWGCSFYYLNEEIISKVIFESVDDGSFFYPLIKFLSVLDFSNSLNPNIKNLEILPIPFGSIIIHTFFYKFLNIYGLILVDLLGIFLFLIIFYYIFLFFNTSNASLLLSVIFFSLSILLTFFLKDYNFIPLNQFKNFFTLRVHRPFPSNLYMFFYIYLILLMSQSLIFRKKYFLLLGTVMGLTFSSFYYFFLIQVLSFLFLVIYKLKFNFVSETIKNIKCIIIFLISFLIVSAPFIWVLIYHEKDLTIGAGVFDLDYQKKLILIKYLLSKIFTIKFIIFNLVIVIYSVYLNVKKTPNYKILNIFNIVYISSIIAPFLFLILSNKASILYHFNNNIVIFGFLSLLIAIIISFKNLINFFSKKLFIYIFLFCIFGIYLKSELNNKKNVNLTRIEFNKITKIIKNKNHNNYYNSILTFDDQFMIWSVLNRKIEYLSLTYAGLTPKSFDLIENDLIHVFKFLNLNSHDWLKFLKNKKNSWKYFNSQVADFFSLRYMANSLNTYNDSLNFPEDTKNFILKTSPIYNQQLAIPNEEFSRLKNKFIKNKDEILFKPKIIILNNDLSFMHKIDIKKSEYCKIFQGQIFTLFLIVSENFICEQTM